MKHSRVKHSVVACGLLAAGISQVATGVTHLWFVATPQSPCAEVITQGEQGVSTVLGCNGCSADCPCAWTITMMFANDAGDLPIAEWGTDLYTSSEVVAGKISADPGSLIYDHPGYPSHPFPTQYGNGPLVLKDAAGADLSSVGSSSGDLAHFTLRKIRQPGNSNIESIHAFNNSYFPWADQQANCTDLQAGDNSVVVGACGTPDEQDDLGTVIIIVNLCNPPCSTIRSDMNSDGQKNGADIGRFLDCLLKPTCGPTSTCCCADTTGDGLVDVSDIPTFVSDLLGS